MARLTVTSLLSALVGGALVALAVGLLDLGGQTTTTVLQQSPFPRPTKAGAGAGDGLTANDIYRRDAPGVVNVRAQIVREVASPFDLGPSQQRGEATGSGFVVDDDGTILTNAHVIEGAAKVTVQFEDGKSSDAKVIGKDNSTDLAVLKVDPKDAELRPLRLGDSTDVQVGDPTIAIGNPFGLDRTLTTGVVSALQRRITAPDGFQIEKVIQTDAAINPGNSGGPLLDATGRVIGINSQIATGGAGEGSIGIGFAVPIDTAKKIVPQLKRNGRVERAYLGITGATIERSLASLAPLPKKGVLVQEVTPGGPAAKAGLRGGVSQVEVGARPLLLGGDVVTKVDGKPVATMDEVAGAVSSKDPGEELTITIVRDGEERALKVMLGMRPNRAVVQ
ncbi:MAG: S1C family serine protease [Solirubrobacteraceae bacterium]